MSMTWPGSGRIAAVGGWVGGGVDPPGRPFRTGRRGLVGGSSVDDRVSEGSVSDGRCPGPTSSCPFPPAPRSAVCGRRLSKRMICRWTRRKCFSPFPDHLVGRVGGGRGDVGQRCLAPHRGRHRRLVEYWKTAVDGPGSETTAEELEERRYLLASKTFEGMVKLDGLFDPVTGDLILTAFDAATPPPGRRRSPDCPPAASRRPRRPGPQSSSTRAKPSGRRNPTSWS